MSKPIVSRPHHSEDGVQIGTVVVEQAAGVMDDAGPISTMVLKPNPRVLGLVA